MIEYKEGCKWCEQNKYREDKIEAIARRVAREEITYVLRLLRDTAKDMNI